MLSLDQVNLVHIVVVAPLLLYVGNKKQQTPYRVYNLLTVLGAIVLVYHGYRYAQRTGMLT
jgi:Mn2+/Fe2+ NRAMP family transporter